MNSRRAIVDADRGDVPLKDLKFVARATVSRRTDAVMMGRAGVGARLFGGSRPIQLPQNHIALCETRGPSAGTASLARGYDVAAAPEASGGSWTCATFHRLRGSVTTTAARLLGAWQCDNEPEAARDGERAYAQPFGALDDITPGE